MLLSMLLKKFSSRIMNNIEKNPETVAFFANKCYNKLCILIYRIIKMLEEYIL